ncbi:winged helix-turn-helix domain-containing protein [Streptacidiphilus jiangxiensis]|uniref:Transcriptional regulatory protein, C terminal n=1 Tax=Streptacidiphilus jiangxiensis TaxID=235985 RepID=A0A1H7HQZ6_STRJI|nr:winged helix-turn-helix domain-containing protein [Streptacidiphilus jiangxiensis]SEK52689.1 Transcriptional regulatory protein, C terminal [Streptacidiphilus jiangxiensis]
MSVSYARTRVRRLHPALTGPTAHLVVGSLVVDGLVVDGLGRIAVVDGRPLRLTRREFDLLSYLVEHRRCVFTRRQLLRAVWEQPSSFGDARTVDVHIARLRTKLGSAHRACLVTVRGVGYKYDPGSATRPAPAGV